MGLTQLNSITEGEMSVDQVNAWSDFMNSLTALEAVVRATADQAGYAKPGTQDCDRLQGLAYLASDVAEKTLELAKKYAATPGIATRTRKAVSR